MCAAFECPSGYGGAKECLGEGKEGHCDLQMPMHLGWAMPYRKTASLSAEVPNFLKGVSGISHDKLKTMVYHREQSWFATVVLVCTGTKECQEPGLHGASKT